MHIQFQLANFAIMFGIFKKKPGENKTKIDWSAIVVDFHSHLIPGVDDGVKTVEDSYTILKAFQNLGYRKIYTSPHIMGEGYTNTSADLKSRLIELKKEELIQSLDIELELIAEYLLDEQFEEKLKEDDFLTFSNRHILLEASMNYEFPFVRDYIYQLIKKGYRPIVAHPERYRYIFGEKNYLDLYETMQDWGVQFQLNLFSLVGLYGDQIRKVAEDLINHELITYVSSDIHHPNQLKFFEQLENSIFLTKLIDSGNLKNHTLI